MESFWKYSTASESWGWLQVHSSSFPPSSWMESWFALDQSGLNSLTNALFNSLCEVGRVRPPRWRVVLNLHTLVDHNKVKVNSALICAVTTYSNLHILQAGSLLHSSLDVSFWLRTCGRGKGWMHRRACFLWPLGINHSIQIRRISCYLFWLQVQEPAGNEPLANIIVFPLGGGEYTIKAFVIPPSPPHFHTLLDGQHLTVIASSRSAVL